jgi:hypothetical protein
MVELLAATNVHFFGGITATSLVSWGLMLMVGSLIE